MNWDSTASVAFDFLFGIIPAVFLGFFSVILLFSTLATTNIVENDFLDQSLRYICLAGIFACWSMVAVSIQRSRIKRKWLHVFGLGIGVILSVLFSLPTALLATPSFVSLIGIPITIVAIKHIVMLTRTRGLT